MRTRTRSAVESGMHLPSRRTLWLSTALLLVVVIGVWFLAPPSRITQANYDRIYYGMTLIEVITILGEPSDLDPRGTQASLQ